MGSGLCLLCNSELLKAKPLSLDVMQLRSDCQSGSRSTAIGCLGVGVFPIPMQKQNTTMNVFKADALVGCSAKLDQTICTSLPKKSFSFRQLMWAFVFERPSPVNSAHQVFSKRKCVTERSFTRWRGSGFQHCKFAAGKYGSDDAQRSFAAFVHKRSIAYLRFIFANTGVQYRNGRPQSIYPVLNERSNVLSAE